LPKIRLAGNDAPETVGAPGSGVFDAGWG